MSRNHILYISIALTLLVIAVLLGRAPTGTLAANTNHPSVHQIQSHSKPAAELSVFATGLSNPRGLKFGPDDALYVAEGGTGGTNSTVGTCDQVPAPIGPYTGSPTGSRISKISSDGTRTIIADNLPSSQTTAQTGSFVSGVGDIAFLGGTLYAVLAGAGCSHGVPDVPNAILKVNPDGSTTQVADLSAFQKANPVKNPDPDDFEPDGTWYSLVAVGDNLYAVEPNHGEIDRIARDGQISRIVDLSALPWIGPTTMVWHAGSLYVGTLAGFPAIQGAAKVYKVTPDGDSSIVADGLTTVLGVAWDDQDRLYVLETSGAAANPGPPVVPGTGRVVRVTSSGLEVIASGLTFPTAMTFGPDGNLYVSNFGFGFPPGKGEIDRIKVAQ